jgi:DNA (cytosine-5)-methyltransferase 1
MTIADPRPRLLDLYCGAGGAAMGYHLAGFHVTGVDIEAQPDYPFAFHRADALDYLTRHAHRYHAVHASPPCQAHTPVSALNRRRHHREHPDLLPATRAALHATALPHVIENVHTRSAALAAPLVLCGTMFDLPVYRHRGFETTLPLLATPPHPRHTRRAMRNGNLPTAERPVMTITGRNGHHSRAWQRAAAHALGTPWITTLNGVCEAIPPAYTHFLGQQLADHLHHRITRRPAA